MRLSQEEIAKSIAHKAHEGQQDKAGKPYIEHPAYVARTVCGDEAKAVAWLHDVIEDTTITFEQLAECGVNGAVLEALRLMTHDPKVPYFDYIRAIKANQLARTVKLADLKHNSNLARLKIITEVDLERASKYQQAIEILRECEEAP